MKALDLYFCSFSDFAKPFREDETLYNQARQFWSHLDNIAWIVFGLAIIVGISSAVTYYTIYNNMTNRHYKPIHWWLFMLCTLLLTLVATISIELCFAKTSLNGALWVEWKIALINIIYALLVFCFVSFVWCNTSLPTNAYRYLKIRK